MSYLCTTFRSERALKTFEVFFEKDLESPKKGFTFATAFRFEKNEAETNAKSSND